jgi:hypothetical protein
VDLESFTIAAYCLVDEVLAALASDPDWRRLRQRGLAPMLTDGEVLTMAVMGEFLGYYQDVAIYHYFLRHRPGWFPALQRGGWPSSLASPWCSPC